ncbi:MAG: hypothetical protein WC679_03270 [Bacteroidales bacterium]|jgi:hypothetical protein
MKKASIILMISAIIVALFSCNDDNSNTITNPDTTSSSKGNFVIEQGVASGEMAITNISHLIQLALDQEDVLHNNGATYPIITKEKQSASQTGDYPMVLTLDFGSDTSVCFDSRYRSGKITATITSNWKDSLSTIEADVQNYYMATHTPSFDSTTLAYEDITECSSNMKLKIKYLGIRNGYENELYPTQYITTDSASISTKLGNVELTTTRYTYYKEGFGTLPYEDDKTINTLYSNGTAIDKKNNSWTWNSKNVTSSSEGLPYFAYNRSCYWLISGDIKLYYKNTSTQQELTHIINFGPSNQTSCNNNASYTSNGTSITITLP